MGRLLKNIGNIISAPFQALKNIVSPQAPKVEQVVTPTPAPMAAPVSAETGVDTTGKQLQRKAKGKKGLMISNNPTSSGGGVGGTGLNI